MLTLAPDLTASLYSTVTAASQVIAPTLVRGKKYLYTCDIGSWVKQGANPTATAGAGSMYVPAGYPLMVLGTRGLKLAVLRNGAVDGNASLTLCDEI